MPLRLFVEGKNTEAVVFAGFVIVKLYRKVLGLYVQDVAITP